MQATPDPGPIITAVKETVDSALQQQVVGFLVITACVFLVIAIAILIYVIRRPANDTDEKDVNLESEKVKSALALMNDKNAARAEKKEEQLEAQAKQHQAEMKEQAKEHRAEMKEMGEQFLAAMQEMNKTNNTIAVSNQSHVTEISAVKTAVEQMATVGSLPLQDVQRTVNEIKDNVGNWSTIRDEDKVFKEDILRLLGEVDRKIRRIDDRLKTKEVPTVAPPVLQQGDTVVLPVTGTATVTPTQVEVNPS